VIYFEELTKDNAEFRFNKNKVLHLWSCEYMDATWFFTSRSGARAWAEDVVFQRHNLPDLTVENMSDEGGWRARCSGQESW
jgi:hypothetical protein